MQARTQTSEEVEALHRIRASRLRKAGLFGAYAEADSPEGRACFQRYAKGRGSYLWGTCGTGKTYAAACAVRMVALDGGRAKLMTAKALLDGIKAEWDGGERDVLQRAERYDLLALDDLGMERPTDWAKETITRLIDTRTMRGLPTIITSNYRLGQLRDIWGGVEGDRLASRIMGACERVEMSGPDRRAR